MMRNLVFACAAVLAALSLGAAPAAAGSCALKDEKAALDLRVLQTEFIVAALNCGHSERYNAFVEKFRGTLVELGADFRAYFDRVHGSRGVVERDKMVTRLANAAVIRSWDWGRAYCPNEAQNFDRVMDLSGGELVAFAASRRNTMDHDVRPCGAKDAPVQARSEPAGTKSSK